MLTAPEVASQLNAYHLVRFDMTASTPEQRALLDRYKLFGPPAILFFAPNGDEWSESRVVGEITATDFAAKLQGAAQRL